MRTNQNVADLLQGKMTSKEILDIIFDDLENQLLDKREVTVNLEKVTFISVYFLERLERFVEKAKKLSVEIKIVNVNPNVYKVFQVGRVKVVLNNCCS